MRRAGWWRATPTTCCRCAPALLSQASLLCPRRQAVHSLQALSGAVQQHPRAGMPARVRCTALSSPCLSQMHEEGGRSRAKWSTPAACLHIATLERRWSSRMRWVAWCALMPRGAGAQVQDVWVLERALLPGGLSRWRASAQISLPPVRPPREPLRRRLARTLGWQPRRPAELTAGAGAERAPLGRAPPPPPPPPRRPAAAAAAPLAVRAAAARRSASAAA